MKDPGLSAGLAAGAESALRLKAGQEREHYATLGDARGPGWLDAHPEDKIAADARLQELTRAIAERVTAQTAQLEIADAA